jgi:hypothetical protein
MAANDEITRVRYFDRQFLRAIDFEAEQTYERDARRRHVLAHHTWGIVVGLELVEVPVTGQTDVVEVVLQPGVAIDGFGRELVSYHPVRLDPAAFDAFHTDAHQTVWLGYHEDQGGAASSNWADCQDGAATRVTEGWAIVVSPPPPETDDVIVDGSAASPPPAPQGTPEIPADESVPYQELPEGPPGDRWLVRLGTVHWDGTTQSFKPAAAGRLLEERRYVGGVAAHLYAPAGTLEIAQRTAPTDVDADDFTTVEGRLRVQGRINAEKEVWIEGERIRFTYPTGEEDSKELTLGREHPQSGAAGDLLRLRLGTPGDATTAFTIGPGAGTAAEDVVRVRADDVVEIPGKSMLTFGHQPRQMVDLWADAGAHQYGLGVQDWTMYFRSDGDFCWFRGGTHNDARDDPGGGTRAMMLDSNSRLYVVGDTTIGTGGDAKLVTRHVQGKSTADDSPDGLWLNWYTGRDVTIGQPGSLDSNLVVSGGVTVGSQGNAIVTTRHVEGKSVGADSYDNLWLNWHSGKDVVVGDPGGNTSSLLIAGDLIVDGSPRKAIWVETYPQVVQNAGVDTPKTWSVDVGGDFDAVFNAFVVLNGFSIWGNNSNAFNSWSHDADVNAMVQHAYVRVTSVSGTVIDLEAYCNESLPSNESDNSILLTLVVIGKAA